MPVKLLHAVKSLATSRGHRFDIITVDSAEMVKIEWSLLEAAYNRRLRRSVGAGEWVRIRRDPQHRFTREKWLANPRNKAPHYDRYGPDGKTVKEYVVGWRLIPSYMLGLRARLHPVSARTSCRGAFLADVRSRPAAHIDRGLRNSSAPVCPYATRRAA